MKATAYFLLAMTFLFSLWEGIAIGTGKVATISEVMAYAGDRWPLIIIGGAGVLAGHWWWRLRREK